MFRLGIDWQWIGLIVAFWLALGVAFGGLIYAVGRFLASRDERRLAKRPLATVYELDLNRPRRRQAPHRYAHTTRTTRHGEIA